MTASTRRDQETLITGRVQDIARGALRTKSDDWGVPLLGSFSKTDKSVLNVKKRAALGGSEGEGGALTLELEEDEACIVGGSEEVQTRVSGEIPA